jgi:hypothetical protein
MNETKNMASLLRENKKLIIILAVALFLIELEIFAVAAMKSGRKSWLQVIDANGNVIHETDGRNLSDFNRHYFEKTFGPFENYEVRLASRDVPFPFRAWFVAAVGLPVGLVLLLAFVLRAWAALFYGETSPGAGGSQAVDEGQSSFEKALGRAGRLNIFSIGFLIFLAVFAYWVIPNLITHLGRVGVDTVVRFKWVFIATAAFVGGLLVWIVYLRYLLARKSIESRTEVEKHRLQLEFGQGGRGLLQIEDRGGAGAATPRVAWQEPDAVGAVEHSKTEAGKARGDT